MYIGRTSRQLDFMVKDYLPTGVMKQKGSITKHFTVPNFWVIVDAFSTVGYHRNCHLLSIVDAEAIRQLQFNSYIQKSYRLQSSGTNQYVHLLTHARLIDSFPFLFSLYRLTVTLFQSDFTQWFLQIKISSHEV